MPAALRPVLLAALAASLSGCLSGAATSALAPAPAGVAALNGGLLARSTTVQLSGSSQRAALEAEYQALQFGRVGQPVRWEDDGFVGEVTPTQLYRVGSQDCRGYTHSVTKDGANVREIGTACRSGTLWSPV